MAWSIRNYNAFVREVRAAHDLTHREAQAAYKAASERLGRPALGVDVRRHPRITKQIAQAAPAAVRRADRRAERERIAQAEAQKRAEQNARRRERYAERKAAQKPKAKAPGAGGGLGGVAVVPRVIESLADYLGEWEDQMEYDYEEYSSSTFDTGSKKK